MSDVMDFWSWFFEEFTNFLWSEPIKYFIGIVLGFFIVKFIYRLLSL